MTTMEKLQFLPLFERVQVEDYPYWFRLRTTAEYWIEYKKGKGFRSCFRTLNPKTWKWNKDKMWTYNKFARLYKDKETGYIHTYSSDLDELSRYLLSVEKWLYDGIEKSVFDHEREMAVSLALSIRYMVSFQGWTVNGVFDEKTRVKPPEISEDEVATIMKFDLEKTLPIYHRINTEYELNSKK